MTNGKGDKGGFASQIKAGAESLYNQASDSVEEKVSGLAPLAQEILAHFIKTDRFYAHLDKILPAANRIESNKGTQADQELIIKACNEELAAVDKGAYQGAPTGSAERFFNKQKFYYMDKDLPAGLPVDDLLA